MVAGVAAGLADAFGLEPNVVRCGFVVLGIASGLGVLLYGVGWALAALVIGYFVFWRAEVTYGRG